MTPMEQLDAAIAAGDLEAIAAARQRMTPKESSSEDEVSEQSYIPEDDGTFGNDKTYCVKAPLQKGPRKNKFVDKLEALPEDDVDKKIIYPKVPDNTARPPHRKVKTRCRECNKDYMVDPAIHMVNAVAGGEKISFVCSSCLMKKGR